MYRKLLNQSLPSKTIASKVIVLDNYFLNGTKSELLSQKTTDRKLA